jgi:molecular chaperone DnaK (HSP70)
MTAAEFVVGIDLGTTHTVVAYATREARTDSRVFLVPQLVSTTDIEARPLLPSVLYAPLGDEQLVDPWCAPPWVTGEVARRRGAEAPGRLVASAKSWLSHAAVDRTAPILPWGGDVDDAGEPRASGPRISPEAASTALLGHVRRAWDEAHPEAPLSDQDVVLTVPASFDEVARELTVSAARAAGLTVQLLEEPLAAFYDYRAREGDRALAGLVETVGASAVVLVCDVGGGTTDLSLVRVSRGEGGLDVARVAVGRHLLLGGDNMDLALAHVCEARLSETPLDSARHGQLVLASRAAKELLLSADAPESAPVAVAPRGSRLVGGALSTRLTRAEVADVVLDGFFPRVQNGAAPPVARAGFLGFGLPYERDLGITRHVRAFFERHARDVGGARAPHALLLNGGVFHSPEIARRLSTAVEAWGDVAVLPHTDPDVAVARGAVAYGLARRGRGAMIRSGSSRGYYVEVAPTAEGAKALVCVVPRGAEEGVVHVAAATSLELVVGRPARFDLFASDDAVGHRAGDVLVGQSPEMDPCPPVFAAFDAGSRLEASVKVALQGQLTATGTLDLACVELEPPPGRPARRFGLAFHLRGQDERPSIQPPSRVSPARGLGRQDELALAAVERVFGKDASLASAREVKDLSRELERLLGERGQWDTTTARAIFDAVARGAKARRRSLDHERVFWQLAGFCLRPGVGALGDRERVSILFRLLPEKLAFPAEVRGWQQFWFAWRRVVAGLDEREQVALRDLVDPFLATPDRGPKRKLPKWRPEAADAMLEMASFLERPPAARRVELGGWVIDRTWTERDPRLWAALGRLGARTPTYATADHVVPAAAVERWLDHLLREKWDALPTAADAALRMARVTGDRARDVPEALRREVARRLLAAGVTEDRVRAVRELVVVEADERAAFFGEAMPAGLRLAS